MNIRMDLPEKEKLDYLNLQKGFLGEKKFDEYLSNLSKDWTVLNDLLLETNNTSYQIDSLCIHSETNYLFEVKNYEGDFYIENDTWYSLSGKEITNPLQQLHRIESLFRRFIKSSGFNYSIESYLIFINPEFHLYNAPRNLQIVFPPQINRFMKNLENKSSNLAKNHTKLVDRLLASHMQVSPYKRIPKYTLNDLKKGITCMKCQSFYTSFIRKTLECSYCAHKEDVTNAVLRSIAELTILFPETKITTKIIHEWCKNIPFQTIQRIISKNFNLFGHGKSAYYVK
ncbi:nuclease-related domain-containing protein [Heyndrickxia sp. NPDC080065]|uniref:nuclease-related domain-containing protein n=1 Tax=Heyndrickxia sp. NPDC080065 TaxID=3390568 RepID=UPI003D02123E